MRGGDEAVGLYVSVPFCRAKCSFCNFASGVGTAEAVERYVRLLCDEIRGVREAAAAAGMELPESVDTIYFGGGTPSLLSSDQMQAIFATLKSQFKLAEEAEVTLEAAPGQIDDALLTTALRLGVNRVSLGVQSFVDREAQAVGRSHTEVSCRAEFRRLRDAGVRNLGVDLIAGLPYQTEESWERSLEVAASSDLQHVSVYMLEVDEDSRLGREVLGGGARLHAPAVPSDELMADLYERACEQLPAAGFGQYEISNFARPGYQSKHNLKYWTRQPYVGVGLDAHSMLRMPNGEAIRWANAEELGDYKGRAEIGSAEVVRERAAFEETVFLGLRMNSGLEHASLQAFPDAWVEELDERARELTNADLMRVAEGSRELTGRGRLVSSAVFGELLLGVAV